MSSYLVQQETIEQIVGRIYAMTLADPKDSLLKPLGRVCGFFQDLVHHPGNELEFAMAKLADNMLHLNNLALGARYHDEPVSYARPWRVRLGDIGNVQLFKSIQCWLYQCAEGDVPADPLYQAFEEFSSKLAQHIVYDLPEYAKAQWA